MLQNLGRITKCKSPTSWSSSLMTVWCAFFWTRDPRVVTRSERAKQRDAKSITNKSKHQVRSDGLKLDFWFPQGGCTLSFAQQKKHEESNRHQPPFLVLSPNTFSNISKWCCVFLTALNCNTGFSRTCEGIAFQNARRKNNFVRQPCQREVPVLRIEVLNPEGRCFLHINIQVYKHAYKILYIDF